MVDRVNRTLQDMLSTFVDENRDDWDDYLPYIMMGYRATLHKSTNCSPNLLMMGREVSLPIDIMMGLPPNTPENKCPVMYIEWLKNTMRNAFDFAYKHLQSALQRQKLDHDINANNRQFNPGNWVWRYYPPSAGQKLGLGWTGLYLVLEKNSDIIYKIQKNETSPSLVVPVDHLKPYRGQHFPENWLLSDEQISLE